MKFTAIIPARYDSLRLPGKPLIEFNGKPMVVCVAEKALMAGAARIIIATDDERIMAAAAHHNVEAVLTSRNHMSGTDRIAEVVNNTQLRDDEIILNVQGDEPLMPEKLIRSVAEILASSNAPMATACHPLTNIDEIINTNVVKVVLDINNDALYFSRATIPWARDAFAQGIKQIPANLPIYRHIGIYAYRVRFLKEFCQLPPAPIEQFESLEQLRVLWHGRKIRVAITHDAPPCGVDSQHDVERVKKEFDRLKNKG